MRAYAHGELMTEEDSLAHYGVRGMKWGQRRTAPDSSGVSRQQARKEIKKDNKQLSRNLEDFETSANRSSQIRAARAQQKQVKRDYSDARDALKDAKKTGEIGRNAARVQLNRLQNTRYETIYKASSKTTGEAVLGALVSGLGSVSTSRLT